MAQWRDNTVDTDPGGVGRSDGRKLNIVVEGCCHGELPIIYASVLKMQQVPLTIFSPSQPVVCLSFVASERWARALRCRDDACTEYVNSSISTPLLCLLEYILDYSITNIVGVQPKRQQSYMYQSL